MRKEYISPEINLDDYKILKDELCNENDDLIVPPLSNNGENLGW